MEKVNEIMKMMESKRFMFEKQYEQAYEKSVANKAMGAEEKASEVICTVENMNTAEEISEFVNSEYKKVKKEYENTKSWVGFEEDEADGKYEAIEEIFYGIQHIMES